MPSAPTNAFLEPIAEIAANQLVSLIENKKGIGWIIVLTLAILVDFADFFLIGTVFSIFFMLVLWQFSNKLNLTGPFLGTRIKIIIWALGALELIPLINVVPAWTIGVIWMFHKARKQAKWAENELTALKQRKKTTEFSDERDFENNQKLYEEAA